MEGSCDMKTWTRSLSNEKPMATELRIRQMLFIEQMDSCMLSETENVVDRIKKNVLHDHGTPTRSLTDPLIINLLS
jgi:hypothetical protein